MWSLIGTVLNVLGILVGGVAGLARPKPLSTANESFFRLGLGAFTVFYGLRLTWVSLSGPVLLQLKQLTIAVLALMLGRLLGSLLRLQRMSNHLGQNARQAMSTTGHGVKRPPAEGFKTCAALFCAAPLGIVGAVTDGLSGYWSPLAVKAVMDGLGAMGFVSIFGWGVLLSAFPVLVLQGSIALACSFFVEPFLRAHGVGLIESVHATSGLLIFSVALVMLNLKKIALADYLPSLAFAPLITWLWR